MKQNKDLVPKLKLNTKASTIKKSLKILKEMKKVEKRILENIEKKKKNNLRLKYGLYGLGALITIAGLYTLFKED